MRELEHRLELERARREAIEAGMERLSARCTELARENALLRERLGEDSPPYASPAGIAAPERRSTETA